MGPFRALVDSTDGAVRAALREVLHRDLAAAPDAVEDLSYGTPALRPIPAATLDRIIALRKAEIERAG